MTDDHYTLGPPERVHPDDPLINGTRWRRERDEAREALQTLRLSAEAYVEELCRALRGMPTHGLGLKRLDYVEADEIATITLGETPERP